MSNPLFNATVKADGRKIIVYKLNKGGYCNFNGCSEEFTLDQLIVHSKLPE